MEVHEYSGSYSNMTFHQKAYNQIPGRTALSSEN